MVLHGHLRFTADLDLFVSLERSNALAALEALRTLRYRPRPPMPFGDLADPRARSAWIENHRTPIQSFFSPVLPATHVDVFVDEPLPFEEAYARAVRVHLKTTSLMVVSIEDLLRMKREMLRPKDREDIRALEVILDAIKQT